MGTRCRVNVLDGNEMLVSVFRQLDGYPSGMGEDLKHFDNCKIINGIGADQVALDFANGMGCFAAQLVKHLKDGVGNVYIRDNGEESRGEEFSYSISERGGDLYLQVAEGSMTMFGLPGDAESEMEIIYSGRLSEFDPEKLAA